MTELVYQAVDYMVSLLAVTEQMCQIICLNIWMFPVCADCPYKCLWTSASFCWVHWMWVCCYNTGRQFVTAFCYVRQSVLADMLVLANSPFMNWLSLIIKSKLLLESKNKHMEIQSPILLKYKYSLTFSNTDTTVNDCMSLLLNCLRVLWL